MDASKHFKKLGTAYLTAIEGALGCRLDAGYSGKSFDHADLVATLKRFYHEWAPVAEGLKVGKVFLNENGQRTPWTDLHSAAEIDAPLRKTCSDSSGIYLMMRVDDPDRIRALLMFADAVLFWDPLEDALRGDKLDFEMAGYALSCLRALRPLIAEGLLVPAQLLRARRKDEAEGETILSHFVDTLMWQGALGRDEFNDLVQPTSDGRFEVDVPGDFMRANGFRGYAENKISATFMPDIVVPVMQYSSLSSYQNFCKNLDDQLQAKQILFGHQSLGFETGFLIDPENLTNDKLIELRERDAIFRAFRDAVTQALEQYEDEIATGHGANFISTFNLKVQTAFANLKDAALVSNTWKEFIDEKRSLTTRILAKVAEAPLAGKQMLGDMKEIIADSGATSAGNLMAASLKTYSRYRNTKLLLDFAASVRDLHSGDEQISI